MGEPGTKEVLNLEDLQVSGGIRTGRKHILSILVENKPGVLARIAGLFARRGFNIDSLAVGATDDTSIARITLTVDGAAHPIDQVTKQLHKLVHVIKIRDLEPSETVARELALFKISCQDGDARAQVMQFTEIFRGKTVDVPMLRLRWTWRRRSACASGWSARWWKRGGEGARAQWAGAGARWKVAGASWPPSRCRSRLSWTSLLPFSRRGGRTTASRAWSSRSAAARSWPRSARPRSSRRGGRFASPRWPPARGSSAGRRSPTTLPTIPTGRPRPAPSSSAASRSPTTAAHRPNGAASRRPVWCFPRLLSADRTARRA